MNFIWYIGTTILSALVLASTIYGVVSLFIDPKELIKSLVETRKKKKEYDASVSYLKKHDYFIAHVIQLGGYFSSIHSMQVFSNEDGGYYLNPPHKFVGIGLNRGGMTVVTPSQLTQNAGFKIDSIGESQTNLQKAAHEDIFHLPMNKMKNEWYIKFVRP